VGARSDGENGRLPLLILSLSFSAIAAAALPFSTSIYIWGIVCMFILLSATSITTLTDAIAADLAKQTHAVACLTLYTILQDIGAATGPFISYFVITFPFRYISLYLGCSLVYWVWRVYG
jgi:hypothetical protein